MHRHGYKGRKFGRETDQRRALIRGLATSLVMEEKIETTLPKAKELVRYIENSSPKQSVVIWRIDVKSLLVSARKLLLANW